MASSCTIKYAVRPIPKMGPMDKANNYHPITLVPTLTKILKIMTSNELVTFLDKNNINNFKFGF
jgi:hypothetical protein